jgi:hypothetical protein
VTGAGGIARTRAERDHHRPLASVSGQVTVSRIACRTPGAGNVHPLDAALSLPEEKQSHGLRKLAAIESARGSFDDAATAVTRATGVRTGKRQLEELALRAAADVDAFYAGRRPGPAPDEHVLVLTGDGKGIVMRPDALRPATAKAAAAVTQKLRPGCHQGKSTAASGWPSSPASTTPPPRPACQPTSSPRPARRRRRTAPAARTLPESG